MPYSSPPELESVATLLDSSDSLAKSMMETMVVCCSVGNNESKAG